MTYDPWSGTQHPDRRPAPGPPNPPYTRELPLHAPAPAVKKSKLPLILGILVPLLVLACCGGTALVAAAGRSGPGTTAPAAVTSTVASPSPTLEPGAAAPTPTTAPVAPVAPPPAPTTRQPAPPPPTTGEPPPAPPTTPSYRNGVHPGAFCSPRGAYGYTVGGVLMQCKPSAIDSRNRWRAV